MKKNITTLLLIMLSLSLFLSGCIGSDITTTSPVITSPPPEHTYETAETIEGVTTPVQTQPVTNGETESETKAETDAETKAETKAETEARTEAPTPGQTRISVVAFGDNIIHDAVLNNAKTYADKTGQTYNFLPIYDNVKDLISEADIAFINQESQIAGDAGKISGYPNFNTPTQLGLDLISLGFDVITTANNHMVDNGTAGLKNSIAYWSNKPVLTVGSYSSDSDYNNIRVLNIKGVKIAVLAYTQMINHDKTATAPYITPLLDKNVLKSQVAYAKTISDLVVVMPHWGDEDDFGITSTQKKYAEYMAEYGVDIVIGCHPHVTGKIEWINRPDGGKMLCAYSLGNFLSTMYYARNMIGLTLSFDIVKNDGDITLENICVIPTVTYFTYNEKNKADEYRENLKIYLLEDFTESLAASHAYNEKESEKIGLSQLYAFVTDNIDKAYLPDYLK